MIIQPRVTTSAALFIGELCDIRKWKKLPWVIRLHITEGAGRFAFSDETGEARLMILASESVELRSEDYAESLPGDKLRLSLMDPVSTLWDKNKYLGPRVTFSCSIT